MMETVLENVCDSVCNILLSDLLNSFYVRVIQAKGRELYLRMKKKRGRIHKNLVQRFILHVRRCIQAAFNFYSKKDPNLNAKFYIDFRLINFNSGHYFKFSVLSKDYYNKNQFLTFY